MQLDWRLSWGRKEITKHNTTTIRRAILSDHDLDELPYVADLCSNLLNTLSCHAIVGRALFVKRDMVSISF